MAKSKPARRSTASHRATWKGQLSFGLVSFTVEAFNALDREAGDIHFHQIHAKCHHRIRYQKVCPVHGEVDKDEIVSGYEVKKGQYVELDPDDLQALRKESDKALTIEAFVSPEAVDPLYFDGRMYYLAPVGAASQEPYAVIHDAMAKAGRCGIGHIVLSGKDQIVLVRPLEKVLHMAMLNYEAEIRTPSSVVHSLHAPKGISRQVKLAETLIAEWTDEKFDFSKFEDPHRENVQELIDAKVKGKEIVESEEDDEEPRVLSLMDALKKSVRGKPKAKKRPLRKSA